MPRFPKETLAYRHSGGSVFGKVSKALADLTGLHASNFVVSGGTEWSPSTRNSVGRVWTGIVISYPPELVDFNQVVLRQLVREVLDTTEFPHAIETIRFVKVPRVIPQSELNEAASTKIVELVLSAQKKDDLSGHDLILRTLFVLRQNMTTTDDRDLVTKVINELTH